MTAEQLSLKYFGTTDYRSALAVLSPSSELVRLFKRMVKEHVKEDIDV